MIEHKPLMAAAAITGSSALVSWFATTLPVLQGIAAIVAIAVGAVALWQKFRPRK